MDGLVSPQVTSARMRERRRHLAWIACACALVAATPAAADHVCSDIAVSNRVVIKDDGALRPISGTAVVSTNSTSGQRLRVRDDAVAIADLYVGVGGSTSAGIDIESSATHTGSTGVLDTAASITSPSVPNPACGSASGGGCGLCGDIEYDDQNVTISSSMRVCQFEAKGDSVISISGDVTIVADDGFTLKDDAEIQLLSGATLTVYVTDKDFSVEGEAKFNTSSASPSRALIYQTSNDDIETKGDAVAYATAVGPDARLKVKDDARFYGSYRGKNVTVESRAIFYVDTNSCSAASAIDHFAISHDASGSTCFAESITITAQDASDATATAYTETIQLTTSTGAGDWQVGSGGAQGSLSPGSADSGTASYAFAAGDAGEVTLELVHTSEATVDIDVTDGSYSEAVASDPALQIGACSISGGVGCSVWYDTSWVYRKALVIDSDQVSSTLTNFPLLISLPLDSDLASQARTDGHDILFTDADGTTKLDHEIESWDDSSGELVAWVRVPSLSASADQPVYMYYGNAGAADQSNATGVWDSYYSEVLHLHDDFEDSSVGNHDATNSGSTDTTGQIADGQDFDGSNDYLSPSTDVENRSEVTLSVWVNAHEQVNSNTIYDEYRSSYWQFSVLQNKFYTRDSSNAPSGTRNNDVTWGPLSTGWHHLAFRYSVSEGVKSVYVDGQLDASSTSSIDALEDHQTGVRIGWAADGTEFDGAMDELRLSLGIARSSGWIATGYRNQGSPSSFYQASLQHSRCVSGPDHFAISHDGTGLNCQAESVAITAHDASHNVDTSFQSAISLATSTNHGNWSLTAGAGTLDDLGSGSGTYAFDASDSGSVTLGLFDTYTETLNIDVVSGSTTEGVGEDDSLAFASSGFVFLADGVQDAIGTQIGGKSSSVAPSAQVLELQAVRTSDSTGACESFLTDDVSVGLAFECKSPSACATNQMDINGTAVGGHDLGATPSYTSVVLDFGGASDTTATIPILFADVGRIQLEAKLELSPSGEVLVGGSNDFVVRPFGFDLGVPGNTAPSDSSGAVIAAAGSDFVVTARAVLWQAADDTNADGIPDGHDDVDATNNADLSDNTAAQNFGQAGEDVVVSASLVAPSGGNDPGLSGDTTIGTFTSGTGSTTSARYEEVGIVELSSQISDSDYLGIGTSESAKAAGRSGRVGRFAPSAFGVAYNTPRFAAGCVTGAFTYLEQPFGFDTAPVITVTALSASGTTTQNYTGSWWKIDNSTLASRSYTAATGTLDSSGAPNAASDPVVIDAGAGTGTLTFSSGSGLIFSRGASATAPFDAEIALSLDVIDDDSVAFASNPAAFGAATAGNGIAFSGGKSMYYGRMTLDNAYGSELVDLQVPLRAEYFDGSVYRLNDADSCSSVAVGDITLTKDPVGLSSVASLDNDPFLLGEGGLWLSAPGDGNPGTVDVSIDLSSATGADLEWLRFDWPADGDSGGVPDEDPTSRATFGIYKGRDSIIYMREAY